MDFNLTPKEYLQSINDIVETRINLILNELKNTYVNYKLYPNVSDYQSVYSNNKQNLESAYNDIFLLNNYVKSSLTNINGKIQEKNTSMNELKKENVELSARYKSLLLGDNAAIGLNHQQSGLYNLSKYNLILTIIGVICISFVTARAFNTNTNKTKEVFNDISRSIQSIGLPFKSNENKSPIELQSVPQVQPNTNPTHPK